MATTYEAMFLLNPATVPDWADGEAEIRRLLDRAGAKILGIKRWDDRKLAYEIGGHKRGTYGLVFFEAEGDKIGPLERDAQLSESILRVLVLRAEGMTPELIEKALAAAAPPRHVDRFEGGRDRGAPGEHGGERPHAPRAEPTAPTVVAAEEAVEASQV
jgi:small subunit ribosomal protein S6